MVIKAYIYLQKVRYIIFDNEFLTLENAYRLCPSIKGHIHDLPSFPHPYG